MAKTKWDFGRVRQLREKGCTWNDVAVAFGASDGKAAQKAWARYLKGEPEQTAEDKQDAILYVITDDTTTRDGRLCCKVGVTGTRLEVRLRQLQQGNPRPLRYYSTCAGIPRDMHLDVETHIHDLFRQSVLPDVREWFALTVEEANRVPHMVHDFLRERGNA